MWALAVLLACGPKLPPASLGGAMECTVRVTAGDDLAAAVAGGGVVCLGTGVHRGGLMPERSVTLVGEPGAVLDAGGRGAVIHVTTDDVEVVLRGLVLANGHAELGAGVRLDGWSTLRLEECAIEGSHPSQGGADLGANRGTLVLERTRVRDVLLTGLVEATFTDSVVSGDLRLREKAALVLEGGQVDGVISVRGTTTRAPSLVVDGTRLARPVDNDSAQPGAVEER